MKRILITLMVLSACLSLVPTASASWGSFVSTGSATGVGNPSCAAVSPNHVVCAVRTGTASIMVNEFNGSTWGGWKVLATSVSSDPSCTSDGAANVICAATATTGALQVMIFNGSTSTWSAPSTVPAALFSAPSCAMVTVGETLCAARNAGGGLAWSTFNGTSWTAFANLSTAVAVSAPSCTTDNNDGVVCAIFTTGGATIARRFASGTWSGSINLGGISGGEPECASLSSAGKVTCFAKAYSSGIYANLYNGKGWNAPNWSGYLNLNGTVNDNAGCTSHIPGQLVCGATFVTDAAFHANVFNGSFWSGWTKVGGSGVGSPACASLGSTQVVCLIMGPTNKLSSVVGP